jgi:hypothetical protein
MNGGANRPTRTPRRRWQDRFPGSRQAVTISRAILTQAGFPGPVLFRKRRSDCAVHRAVAMMLIVSVTASLLTVGGRSASFVGALTMTVYVILAMTSDLLQT